MYQESQHIQSKPIKWISGISLLLALGLPLLLSAPEFEPKEILGLGIVMLVVLPIVIMLWVSRLQLVISPKGIQYQFWGMQWKKHFVRWQEIEYWQIHPVDALGDYGGWGLRTNFDSWGYITRSGEALEIRIQPDKVRVFSLKNPQEAYKWLTMYASELQKTT